MLSTSNQVSDDRIGYITRYSSISSKAKKKGIYDKKEKIIIYKERCDGIVN